MQLCGIWLHGPPALTTMPHYVTLLNRWDGAGSIDANEAHHHYSPVSIYRYRPVWTASASPFLLARGSPSGNAICPFPSAHDLHRSCRLIEDGGLG